jgi:hypothetical protein
MVMPVHREVGDRVVLTQTNIDTMHSSNRSCVTPNYPSDSFLKKLSVGMKGEVTHTFKPGYELSVRFDNGESFHMKDNWVTNDV